MAKNTLKHSFHTPESVVTCPAGHQFAVIRLKESARTRSSLYCPVCAMEMSGVSNQRAVQPGLIGRLSPPKKHLQHQIKDPSAIRRAAGL